MRISPSEAVTIVRSRSVAVDAMSPEAAPSFSASVCTAVAPWRLTSMLMPLSSNVRWRSASDWLAESTSRGTSLESFWAWSAMGLASRNPTVTSVTSRPT